jgi:hypothetical protein
MVTHDERMTEGFDRVHHIPIVGSLVVDCGREEMKSMPDWLWFIAFLATYIVLMRWVLPRLIL